MKLLNYNMKFCWAKSQRIDPVIMKMHPEFYNRPDYNKIIIVWMMKPKPQDKLIPDDIYKTLFHCFYKYTDACDYEDICPNCGSFSEVWSNSSDELQCDNCGYSESE